MTEEQIVILVCASLLTLAILLGLIRILELNRTLNTLRSEYIKIKRDCDLLSSRVENHIERKIIYCQRVCPFDQMDMVQKTAEPVRVSAPRIYADGKVMFGTCSGCGATLKFPAQECPKCKAQITW